MNKKILVTLALCLSIGPSRSARADMFGGDVVLLAKILANTIQQLIQLRQMVRTAQSELALMRNLNRGIDAVFTNLDTVSAEIDPGLYGSWQNLRQAIAGIEGVYGKAGSTHAGDIQRHIDRFVGEAITHHNQAYQYAQKMDRVGERIKSQSGSMSPKGAQKLTVQSLGSILHSQNESLRMQAHGVKLNAEQLARQNHQDKVYAGHIAESTDALTRSMKKTSPGFKFMRF
jgi:hypothetical protein